MFKIVTHKFGTSEYDPTQLEGFVEKLASEWGVELSDLGPTQTFSYGPFLERKASTAGEGDDQISIWYTRNPSEATRDIARGVKNSENYMGEVTPHLYADNEPSSEFANLTKGDRRVVIQFRPDGMKSVTVKVTEVAEALGQAQSQAPIYGVKRDDAVVKLDFNATAHREKRDENNPVGDMQNAFNFVQNYLRR